MIGSKVISGIYSGKIRAGAVFVPALCEWWNGVVADEK